MQIALDPIGTTSQRVFSIDALRGITIFVMIFVNELAGVSGLPGWMKHADADADAMTFVDVVFPGFLFIVGMSIPFAITRRLEKDQSLWKLGGHILSRTTGLLVLGVFMVNTESGYNEQSMGMSVHLWALSFYMCVMLVWNQYRPEDNRMGSILRAVGIIGLLILALIYRRGDNGEGYLAPQWWGILGLIGWAYFLSMLIYLLTRGSVIGVSIAILVCTGIFALTKSAPEQTVLSWLGRNAGHATHTSIVLAGILLTLVFLKGNSNDIRRKMTTATIMAVAFLIAGFFLRSYFPISKIYATPPWAFLSVASCIIIFIVLYLVTDVAEQRSWTRVIHPAAANPLLAYIIPSIIFHAMRVLDLQWPSVFYRGSAGILWALAFSFIVMVIVWILNKWKIKLQL